MRRITRTGQLLAIALACAVCGAARAEVEAPTVALSEHAATRAEAVSPPVISAPTALQTPTDFPVNIQADASDPDAGDVLTITQSGAPASLTFSHTPSVTPATATLSGTLTAGDIGSYMIQWQVSDGTFMASATTNLTVVANSNPVVTAPATALAAVGVGLVLNVSASDPDGEPIDTFTAAPLPAGATFAPNGFKTSGILNWTPVAGQENADYTVTFSVTSGSPARSASAVTVIHVNPLDRAAVITFSPGGTSTIIPGVPFTYTATATDPDGDAINDHEVEGTQGTELPPGVTFTLSADKRMAFVSWTPSPAQIGNVGIAHIVRSGALDLQSAVTVKRINVIADRPPVVTAPTSVTGSEGNPIAVNVTASDPDAQAPGISSLTTSPLPLGATFASNAAHTSGTLNWVPDFTQAGIYSVTFTAMNALTGSATTQITVSNINRAPTANAGGPYTGVTSAPVSFNGSGSSDPDGNPLAYSWAFGDGGLGSGANPQHTYAAAGNFVAALTVCDNGTPPLCGSATAAVTIQADVSAQIILKNNGDILDAWNAAHLQEIAIEEVLLPYSDLDLTSLKLTTTRPNAGSVAECFADSRSFRLGDKDGDGIGDFAMSFSSKCVKNLLKKVPTLTPAEIVISGVFNSGGGTTPLNAVRTVTVRTQEFPLPSAPFAYPNPFNPETSISYSVVGNAQVSIRIYSVDGRLVRTLRDNESQTTGSYEVRWNGTNEQGDHMSSGIYFVKTSQKVGDSEQSSVLKLALTK